MLDTIAVLGDRDGPGVVHQLSSITMGPDGRFLVHSGVERCTIKVFGPDGRFQTQFGRRGEGPGEYQGPMAYPGAGIIHVVDGLQRRVTSLTPDFQVLDTRALPFFPTSVARVGPNRLVFAAVPRAREHTGPPLHLYDHEAGEVLRSFGAIPEPVAGRNMFAHERTVAAGANGSVWSAPPHTYRIERWDTAGVFLAAYERQHDDVLPWDRGPERATESPLVARPPPQLTKLSEDEDGRVWVLVRTGARDWRPTPPSTEAGAEEEDAPGEADRHEWYDTVVEVIRPGDDEALLYATERFPGWIRGFAGPGILYSYNEDDPYHPRYSILQLRIVP